MRFIGILRDVFLHLANDLNRGYFTGHADHPVLLRNTSIIVAEAISETFNPAQTGGMVVDADEVSVRLVIYI